MVNNERPTVRRAEEALRRVLHELGGVSLHPRRATEGSGANGDVVLQATSAETSVRIAIEARSRITPQTAISLAEQMRQLPQEVIPLVYAPVISPRVAEILRQAGVGYLDEAGNCYLRSSRHRILIDRRGYRPARRPSKGAVDPFSPKSSRIVRALLTEPAKGWHVRELAEHPDVNVSVGLVSKVKRALVEEGYAVERKRRLHLRDPVSLLENWSKKYCGPAEQLPMYFRGDVEAAEEAVGRWCHDHQLAGALAGLSAAWRLAPEVRYSVGAVYVETRGWDIEMLEKLKSDYGCKRVDTGANVLVWQPFDASVLVAREARSSAELPVTSPLQTFLDLKRLTGRGEEAAVAVYDKHLADQLQETARRVEEIRDA